MHVQRVHLRGSSESSYEVVTEDGQPIAVVSSFLRHLGTRGYSPNTLSAYAYDLLHFMTFLQTQHLTCAYRLRGALVSRNSRRVWSLAKPLSPLPASCWWSSGTS